MMKLTRLISIVFAVTALLTVTSCHDDLSKAAVESSIRKGRRVRSEMTVLPVEDPSATKSSYAGGVATVSDWMLWQFEDGVLKAQYYQDSGDNISNIEVVSSRVYNWYAWANCGDLRSSFTVGTTAESAMAALCSTWDYNESTLPMSWTSLTDHPEGLGFTVEQIRGGTALPVTMTRLVARHDIVVDKSGLTDWSVNVTDLCVSGDVAFFPFTTNRAAGYGEMPDRASAADLTRLNGGSAATFYSIENQQGTLLPGNSDPWQKKPASLASTYPSAHPTFIEVAGTATLRDGSAKSVALHYRFCLGQDNVTNFDVVRNTANTVTLILTDASVWDAIEEGDSPSNPLWKIEAGSFTDDRSIAWADESLVLPSSTVRPESVLLSPSGMSYQLLLDQVALNAGVRVFTDSEMTNEVTPSAFNVPVTVDGSTTLFFYTTSTTTVSGSATVRTLDGRHSDVLPLVIGRTLSGLRMAIWNNNGTTEGAESNRTDTTFVTAKNQYLFIHAYAQYSDGTETDVTSSLVTGDWSVSPSGALVNETGSAPGRWRTMSGAFFVGNIVVTATYTGDGVTVSGTARVTLLNKPVSVEISGPRIVRYDDETRYTATVTYADGATADVTDAAGATWSVSDVSSRLTTLGRNVRFASKGVLSTTISPADYHTTQLYAYKQYNCAIHVSYTENGFTVSSNPGNNAYTNKVSFIKEIVDFRTVPETLSLANDGSAYFNSSNEFHIPYNIVATFHDGEVWDMLAGTGENYVVLYRPGASTASGRHYIYVRGMWDLHPSLSELPEYNAPFYFYQYGYKYDVIYVEALNGDSWTDTYSRTFDGEIEYDASYQTVGDYTYHPDDGISLASSRVMRYYDFSWPSRDVADNSVKVTTWKAMEKTHSCPLYGTYERIPIESMRLDPQVFETVVNGDPVTYQAIVRYSNGVEVSNFNDYTKWAWTVDGSSVTTPRSHPNQIQVVPGSAPATRTITATFTPPAGSPVSATATMTVSDRGNVVSLTLTPDDQETTYGHRGEITATAAYEDGSTKVVNNAATWYTTPAAYNSYSDPMWNGWTGSNGSYYYYYNAAHVLSAYATYTENGVTVTSNTVTIHNKYRAAAGTHDHYELVWKLSSEAGNSYWKTTSGTVSIGTEIDFGICDVYTDGSRYYSTGGLYASEVRFVQGGSGILGWSGNQATAIGTGTVEFYYAENSSSNVNRTVNTLTFNVTAAPPKYRYRVEVTASPENVSTGETTALSAAAFSKYSVDNGSTWSDNWDACGDVTASTTFSAASGSATIDNVAKTASRSTAGTASFTGTTTGLTSDVATEYVPSNTVTWRDAEYKYKVVISASPLSRSTGEATTLSAAAYRQFSTDGGSSWSGTWESYGDVTANTTFSKASGTATVSISGNSATGTTAGTGVFTGVTTGLASQVATEYVASETVTWMDAVYKYKVVINASPASLYVGETASLSAAAYSKFSTNGGSTWSGTWESYGDVTANTVFSKASGTAAVSISGNSVTGTAAGTGVFTGITTGLTTVEAIEYVASETVTWSALSYAYKVVTTLSDATVEVESSVTASAALYRKTFVDGSATTGWIPQGDVTSSGFTAVSGGSHVSISGSTVTGVSEGAAAIRSLYSENSPEYEDAGLTVTPKPVYAYRIVPSPASVSVSAGGSADIGVTLQRSLDGSSWEPVGGVGDSDFAWSDGGSPYFEVNGSGSVSGTNATTSGQTGVVTVSITYDGNSVSNTVPVAVAGKVLQSIYVPDAKAKAFAPDNSVAYGDNISFTCMAVYDYGPDEDVTSSATWGDADVNLSHSANTYTCTQPDASENGVANQFVVSYEGMNTTVHAMGYPKYVTQLSAVFDTSYRLSDNDKPKGAVTFNDGSTATLPAGQLDRYAVFAGGASSPVRVYEPGDDVDMRDLGAGGFDLRIYYTSLRYGTSHTLDAGVSFVVASD